MTPDQDGNQTIWPAVAQAETGAAVQFAWAEPTEEPAKAEMPESIRLIREVLPSLVASVDRPGYWRMPGMVQFKADSDAGYLAFLIASQAIRWRDQLVAERREHATTIERLDDHLRQLAEPKDSGPCEAPQLGDVYIGHDKLSDFALDALRADQDLELLVQILGTIEGSINWSRLNGLQAAVVRRVIEMGGECGPRGRLLYHLEGPEEPAPTVAAVEEAQELYRHEEVAL